VENSTIPEMHGRDDCMDVNYKKIRELIFLKNGKRQLILAGINNK
jgi:hypothetical protein